MWQMGGLGPMLGQAHHFRSYAPEKIQYGIDRYTNEANRLYGVLDKQLEGREYIAGDFSIADIACWPWIVPYERQGQRLEDTPHLEQWFERMKQRPAVQRGFELGSEQRRAGGMDEKAKQILFGQTARK
jgi:GST-like protein